MAPTYNDPTRSGQPSAPDAEAAARRLADQLLLATCAASDHAAEAEVERRLRQAALRFALAGTREADLAAESVLAELREECGVDAAMAVLLDASAPSSQVRFHVGDGAGMVLVQEIDAALVAAVTEALRRNAAIEHPAEERPVLPATTLARIDATGVRCLRWVARRLEDGLVLVVALHSATAVRYWTPPRRRFHDGVADILAAVLGGGRSTRDAEGAASEEPGPAS